MAQRTRYSVFSLRSPTAFLFDKQSQFVFLGERLMSASRKRDRTSPQSDSERIIKKSYPIMESQTSSPHLLSAIKDVVADLLDSKLSSLASKDDISDIKNDLKSLKEENARLRTENKALRERLRDLDSRLEDLEVKSRQNNLIFKGLKHSTEDNVEQVITSFCKQVFNVDISPEKLQVRHLGANGSTNSPLLVTFLQPKDKFNIIKSSHMLKGSGFVIFQDLPVPTRKKKMKLLLLRREIQRLNPRLKVKIRPNYILVDGKKFFWSLDDGLRFGHEDGISQLNLLVGCNLSDFLKAVHTDSLARDYFKVQHKPSNSVPQQEKTSKHSK